MQKQRKIISSIVRYSLLFCFLIGISAGRLSADTVYVAKIGKEFVRVSNYFSFFQDANHSDDYKKIFDRKDFKFVVGEVPNFNITSSTVWAKARLTTNESSNWYLAVSPSTYLNMTCYQRLGNGKWKEASMGVGLPNSLRPFAVNHFFFKLDLVPGDTLSVLLKVHDYYPVSFDLNIGPLESFIELIHYFDLYNAICYGIMLMMLIYNLYLFVSNGGVAYIYYVCYVTCNLIFISYLSGYAVHYPEWLLSILRFAPVLPPAGFGIFGLLFALQLFKEALPKGFVKFIYFFIALAASHIVFSISPYKHAAEIFLQGLGLLLAIISITAGIIATRKKVSSAKYYLIGFGIYMSALLVLILTANGVFSFTRFTPCLLVTGSVIEIIFLSFALGDKFKIAQKEKERAQREALNQAMENEKLVKEQNVILEKKVKERTLELEEQKEIVEEKNKEIVDSINYAKRIQYTLLAQDHLLNDNLKDYFIFFKPKDIVSGDFYWATKSSEPGVRSSDKGNVATAVKEDELFYLAVCDSTGHGVPGAFMSLLNTSFLNEAINDKAIQEPGEVFNYTRKKLIENISQENQKDGMDGILVRFEKNKKVLKYAAANNQPLLIRNGSVMDLGYDKMPVGKGEKTDAFKTYEIHLEKGDLLYVFTDGYADQFGGPKGKKFKYRQLEEKLIDIHLEPLHLQRSFLETVFNEWKGELEQVDDVLIIGIKF